MLRRLLGGRIFRVMSQDLKRTNPQDETILGSTLKKIKVEIDASKTDTTTTSKQPATSITEASVGITRFINPNHTGFKGLLKTLHSDFQVNEIQPNGTVVHLTDEGVNAGKSNRQKRAEKLAQEQAELEGKSEEEIAEIKARREKEREKERQEKEALPKYTLSEEDKAELLTMITQDELQQMEDLFHTGNNMETKTTFDDKEQRTKLHQLIRRAFQGKLETITSPEQTFKVAIAKNRNGANNRGGGQQQSNPQDSMHHVDENGVVNYGLGPFKPYLHFTLYKTNRDTMDVIHNISKLIRTPNKSISFAGTKDRRGVTCQRVSIHRGKVLRVNALNNMRKSNFKLGAFAYEDEPLKLGDLKGNEFTITLRDVKLSGAHEQSGEVDIREIINQSFASLKEKGFINYFGLQRFGSFSVATHKFGIALLHEDWGKFVELLLSEQEIQAPGTAEMRRIWKETRDPKQTLKKLQQHYVAENSVLKVLAKEPQREDKSFSPHSYLMGIMSIPKNLRMMYVHAYQSYIWNIVASKRLELFGLEVQEGDLVLESEDAEDVILGDDLEDKEDEMDEDVVKLKKSPVKIVTKEDIENKKYTIYDVVLPSPGFKVQLPENAKLKQVYIDEMAKDGLDPYNLRRKNIVFSLTGAYRHLVTKPMDASYDLISYKDGLDGEARPLVKTDLEILEEKKQYTLEGKSGEEGSNISRYFETKEESVDDAHLEDKLAVVLRMQLGVSSYATMALREFMKIDTSRGAVN